MRRKIITCPRCKEQYEWRRNSEPPLGWFCEYCSEYLDMPAPSFNNRELPLNDMEERRLEEDWDGELDNIPLKKNPIPESKFFLFYLKLRKKPLLFSRKK